jgi:DNA-binding PadR family transcriptional regulator
LESGRRLAGIGSAPKRRIGRGAVLLWIKEEIGRGGLEITAEAVSRRFGWLIGSSRDALNGLCADGALRIAWREPPHGRAVYELTASGAAKRSKQCRSCHTRKPESGFHTSRWTCDGLADLCKACIAAAKRAGRHEGAPRRAARVAAP